MRLPHALFCIAPALVAIPGATIASAARGWQLVLKQRTPPTLTTDEAVAVQP